MIWVSLLALSLLYVLLLGIKLWRHVVALGRECSEATARLGKPSVQFSQDLAGNSADPLKVVREPGWAVDADPAEVHAEYRSGKLNRKLDRTARRVERRSVRGQAQSLRDLQLIDPDLKL